MRLWRTTALVNLRRPSTLLRGLVIRHRQAPFGSDACDPASASPTLPLAIPRGALRVRMNATPLEIVFRNCSTGHGLSFFKNDEPHRLSFRETEGRFEILCPVRKRWKRATPEEVVRQCFILWIQETLHYPLTRIGVEERLQRGHDADKERIDVVVFSDDARSDRFIVFELKKPDVRTGNGNKLRELKLNVIAPQQTGSLPLHYTQQSMNPQFAIGKTDSLPN